MKRATWICRYSYDAKHQQPRRTTSDCCCCCCCASPANISRRREQTFYKNGSIFDHDHKISSSESNVGIITISKSFSFHYSHKPHNDGGTDRTLLSNLKISNVKIERDHHIESQWIRLQRMYYNQNGLQKTWDIAITRDSVSCLIYQKSQKAFIIVKVRE